MDHLGISICLLREDMLSDQSDKNVEYAVRCHQVCWSGRVEICGSFRGNLGVRSRQETKEASVDDESRIEAG